MTDHPTPKAELVLTPTGAAPLDLARLDLVETPVLLAALGDALRLTAKHLLYAAAIWKEAEARGADLSRFKKIGIGTWLPAIADGSVLPDTVVNYIGQPALLKKVAALPPHQQRDIADGKQQPPELRYRGSNARQLGTSSKPLLPGQPPRTGKPAHGEPSDDDLDAACEARQPMKPLEMLAAMIANASPGDAADLVADCVRGVGTSAPAVALRLIPLLEQIARQPVKRPLSI